MANVATKYDHNQAHSPYVGMELPELIARRASVDEELQVVKALLESIDDAINERCRPIIDDARELSEKHEGRIRVVVDGVEVVSDIPKRVEWNSIELDNLAGEFVAMGHNPEDWIDWKLSIPESKYKAMPPALRSLVDAARTTKHGKEKISFDMGDGK